MNRIRTATLDVIAQANARPTGDQLRAQQARDRQDRLNWEREHFPGLSGTDRRKLKRTLAKQGTTLEEMVDRRPILLPKPQEAIQALGVSSLADLYANGVPESYAKAAREAAEAQDILRAVNLYVCAATVSAGQSRSDLYEDLARELLRQARRAPGAAS